MATLDVLLTVAILVLLLITLVGIVWAIIRERHMVNMHNQQTHALGDVERTITDGTEAIEAGFNDLRRQIERSEDITETKRQEIIRLILDSERRCMDTMRDLIRNLQQGMQINFNHDVDRANVNTGSGRQHNG